MDEPLWVPTSEQREHAQLTRFRALAAKRAGRALDDYDALYSWSIEDTAAFWSLFADFAGVRFSTAADTVQVGHAMPGTTWFEGARLNFAEHLLQHMGPATALVAVDEHSDTPIRMSRDQLRAEVAGMQAWLEAQGVGPGDRVAAWMPNRIETVIAMLAATSLGAIFSSSSPDFGPKGVLDRFGQIEPKVLIASDGARYGGKTHDLMPRLHEVAEALEGSLEAVLVVSVLSGAVSPGLIPKGHSWPRSWASDKHPEPHFAQLPFDHPLYIMYSSGTTGVPKCIVHGAGGTLLQHLKEHRLHTDLSDGDSLFYFTTTGWMMWNWLVSGLAVGATVVLWDGSPVHPSKDALWRTAAELGVNVFGTSPKFLTMCEKGGQHPSAEHDLSALRAVLSTGSPLSVENFTWVYKEVGDVQLASIAGGTDIISCFMLGCPTEPVYAGEIQKRGLGMAVEAWTDDGESVVCQKAELVCTRPFPSMPIGFWRDEDGSRYRAAYFEHFPGVWRHGDYVEITEHGGVIIHGRSDATLNPGGVRIGTAEIYRPVEAMDEVVEAVVVGIPAGDDIEVVLYVVLVEGTPLNDELRQNIRTRIRATASPRHVPTRILAAPAVPRTISGKKVEIAVMRALTGANTPNRDALANPGALDWFAAQGAKQS